ncbi:MAG: methyltransferase domain-containing protein [Betaproteobacteria bacterium]|nr:methyltransferase domain-containing protein [Betaproteobacteria bacterium]
MSTFLAQPRVLWSLVRGVSRHGSLAQRLNRFYGPQAEQYDETRLRLLHGRRLIGELVDLRRGDVVVELGAGTGATLDILGAQASRCREILLVDICEPLLAVARRRAREHGNVRVVEADATTFDPGLEVDVVVMSYTLTMIPDWFLAIDNAARMLRPGGQVVVTDFHVSRAEPMCGLRRQGFLARHFWPMWFGHDGVRPNPDHLPYLMARFDTTVLMDRAGGVPGLPWVRVPYYVYMGRKRG